MHLSRWLINIIFYGKTRRIQYMYKVKSTVLG